MPIAKYYGGHGEEVMQDMRERYGDRAEQVFYATKNKRENVKAKVSRARRTHELKRKMRKG